MFLASDITVKINNCPWDVGRFCRYVNIEQRMSSRDRNMSKWLQKWFTFALCTLEVVKYFRSKISIILRALRPITTSSQSFYISCSTTLYLKTSQELRMLSPSLCIQRSHCNCSYCCSQLSEM